MTYTEERIAVGLNEKGIRELLHWLVDNLLPCHLVCIYSWLDDVDLTHDNLGHIEIGRYHSASGNPVTYRLGADCFEYESVVPINS